MQQYKLLVSPMQSFVNFYHSINTTLSNMVSNPWFICQLFILEMHT